ncbi:LacI family DNA-binding transcriptional regulator, partial [Aquipuribacter hungaricus]
MTHDGHRRDPVMHDVGRLAGVSQMTVSRVLNDRPHVRPETRARVERAIEHLGYRRNAAARALATGSPCALGVVAARAALPGSSDVLLALEEAARRRERAVTVATVGSMTTAAVQEAVGHLDGLGVDGVVLVAPQPPAPGESLRLPTGVPVVVVDGPPHAGLPSVVVDQAAGARLMTEHLLGLGHRTVHHVAGLVGSPGADERAAGWKDALEAAGRPVPPLLRGSWTAAGGHAAGRRLARDPCVTAVFAADDRTALGVVRALQEAGRRVPEDVSVGGFEDVPEAPFVGPALSSVSLRAPQLGEAGIATLLALVDGGGATPGARARTTAPLLVVR